MISTSSNQTVPILYLELLRKLLFVRGRFLSPYLSCTVVKKPYRDLRVLAAFFSKNGDESVDLFLPEMGFAWLRVTLRVLCRCSQPGVCIHATRDFTFSSIKYLCHNGQFAHSQPTTQTAPD